MKQLLCDYCNKPIIFGEPYIKANLTQGGITFMDEYDFHKNCFYKMLKKEGLNETNSI